jgi:hypothetical protein
MEDILETLTPEDTRTLVIYEDELERSRQTKFHMLLPSPGTSSYLQFIDKILSYPYLLIAAWEDKYRGDRKSRIERLSVLTQRNHHLA